MMRALPWRPIGVAVAVLVLACGQQQSLLSLDVTADRRYQDVTLRIDSDTSVAKVFAHVTLDPSSAYRVGIYLPAGLSGTVHVDGQIDDGTCVLARGSVDIGNVQPGGSVGPVTLALHTVTGCESPAGDGGMSDRPEAAAGTGGAGQGGSGGLAGDGGRGAGGAAGAGGTGAGGSGTGGSGTGGVGTGSGGAIGTGGLVVVGTGGAGSGGRPGTGGAQGTGGTPGATCIDALRNNGYTAGAQSCASCTDNGTSLNTQCQAVIDCMAPIWPCTGSCLTNCLNHAAAGGVVQTCVMALTDAACNGAGSDPCAGLCTNPTVFTSTTYTSSSLGTLATCHETTANLTGAVCENFTTTRTFSVNGVAQMCATNIALPPKRNGGYCFQASAGQPSYASFATY